MNLDRVRLRLFVVQLGGMAALLVLLIGLAYAVFQARLHGDLRERLRSMGKAVVFSVEFEEDGISPYFDESIYLSERPDRIDLGPEAAVQWADQSGRVLRSRGGLTLVDRPWRDQEVVRQSSPPAYVYTLLAHTRRGQAYGFARTALSLAPLQRQLRSLLIWLSCAGGLTLAFGGAAIWWWTGRALAPIQHAYQELETFSGAVSHELRSPLTALRANCEGLLKRLNQLQPGELEECLRELDEVSADMARLVDELLLLARSRGGQEDRDRGWLDAQPVLREVAASLEPLSERLGVSLESRIEAGGCALEESHLRLIARNLIENALRYSEAGSQVQVRAGGRPLRLEVIDRGEGIAADELPRIFEPFWRADRARTRNRGGSGLGLALVDSLVRAQGGEVRVQSQPGQGSTFIVQFS